METENTVEKINKSVAIQYEEAKKEKEFDFDAAFSEENFKMTPLSILMLRTINWEDRIKDSVSGWATNPLYLLSATKLPTKKQIITVGFGSIEYEDVLFQLSKTPRLCSEIRIEAENIEQLQSFITFQRSDIFGKSTYSSHLLVNHLSRVQMLNNHTVVLHFDKPLPIDGITEIAVDKIGEATFMFYFEKAVTTFDADKVFRDSTTDKKLPWRFIGVTNHSNERRVIDVKFSAYHRDEESHITTFSAATTDDEKVTLSHHKALDGAFYCGDENMMEIAKVYSSNTGQVEQHICIKNSGEQSISVLPHLESEAHQPIRNISEIFDSRIFDSDAIVPPVIKLDKESVMSLTMLPHTRTYIFFNDVSSSKPPIIQNPNFY